MDEIVECPNCSWQGADHQTNSSHCPECGDQTFPLHEIYDEEDDNG